MKYEQTYSIFKKMENNQPEKHKYKTFKKNHFTYLLSEETKKAVLFGAESIKGEILIPRSFKKDGQEYTIVGIRSGCFNFTDITSIRFSADSKIRSIKNRVLSYIIKSIVIPPSVSELEEQWCENTDNLINVQIMPNNQYFMNIDNKLVLGKTNKKRHDYDVLLFARRDIKTAKIPSFVKRIASFAFQKSSVENVSIPSKVEEISEGCFKECKQLANVTTTKRSHLRIIGKDAFLGSKIESINIPSSVTVICESAFAFCKSLKNVEISKDSNLQEIQKSAFEYTHFESIFIPSQVTSIGECAFKDCIELRTVEIASNSNLQKIGRKAFKYSRIESFQLPKQVTIIAEKAFYKCYDINDFYIPNDSQLQIIEKKAFGVSNVVYFYIPETTTRICENAFYKSRLQNIEISVDSENLTIEKSAFDSTDLYNITMPSTVLLEENWSLNISKLTSIGIFPKQKQNIKYYYDKLILGKTDPKSDEFDDLILARRDIESVEIPHNIKIINFNAFADSLIESIFIPPSVTHICENAFKCCAKLFIVEISPDSENLTIDNHAFNSSDVEIMSMPSSIFKFKENWCCRIQNLKYIQIIPKEQQNIIYYEDKLILGKSDNENDEFDVLLFVRRDIENVTIPPNIKQIGSHAFSYSPIKNLIIPSSVTKIGEDSFFSCRNLIKVEIPQDSQLQFIGKGAFTFTNIESIFIPKNVTQIYEETFEFCDRLKRIDFAKDSELREIGENVFMNVPSCLIQSIILPPHLTNISKMSFAYCYDIIIFEIDENTEMQTVKLDCFKNCDISLIMIPTKLRNQIEPASLFDL